MTESVLVCCALQGRHVDFQSTGRASIIRVEWAWWWYVVALWRPRASVSNKNATTISSTTGLIVSVLSCYCSLHCFSHLFTTFLSVLG